ncbi:MAG: hypothetical protein JNN32_12095 [Flavobacteriales bacterium]|nr:hypothetical protein [Flavobacteriales bacterium]
MRPFALIGCVVLTTAVYSQLKKHQLARLAQLDYELSYGWKVSEWGVHEHLIGGQWTKAYTAHLFTPLTARDDGDNEGVSLHFFKKALADSVEASFAPVEDSTYEFIYTKSYVVVIAYFSSNGKLYDMYTRYMLKDLRNHFTNWHSEY